MFLAGLCVFLSWGSAAAASSTLPLKGQFEGVGNNFSGTITPLGNFTGVFDPITLSAIWTATNGDTVTNQTIAFDPVEELAPNIFNYEQSLVITGGTGRFFDAAGSADIVGLIDFGTGAFDGDLDGEISVKSVPEPSATLGLLAVTGIVAASRSRSKKETS